MELIKLISYLDYGVLGLSAIILILSFVLLAREQRREEFRPLILSAIRQFMLWALAFASISLIATVIDKVIAVSV